MAHCFDMKDFLPFAIKLEKVLEVSKLIVASPLYVFSTYQDSTGDEEVNEGGKYLECEEANNVEGNHNDKGFPMLQCF